MIIDTLANAPKYFSAHPLFAKAFEYISQTDLANAADGKSDISDGLKAIYSNAPGKTIEVSLQSSSVIIRILIFSFALVALKLLDGSQEKNV